MIVISQYGNFHARHGAEAAHEMEALQVFVTNSAQHTRIPTKKIYDVSEPIYTISRIIGKTGRVLHWKTLAKQQSVLMNWGKQRFSLDVEKRINSRTKIFHAFSAFQENCWDKCEEYNVKKIIDWGIAHPNYLNKVLKEESQSLGVDYEGDADTDRILNELHRADRIVIPSVFVEETFIENGFPKEKLFRTPYGVDLDLFYPIDQQQIPASDKSKQQKTLRVATTGMMSIRKGTYYLLEAMKYLKQREKSFELYLFGSPMPNMQEKVSEYNDIITYMSSVPHTELVKWYRNVDVFVLPSLGEGMARVVLEAMACGVPCIVTPNCGYEGIIQNGKNGWTIPIRNSQAISEILNKLYENPEQLSNMKKNALKTARQYSWDIYKNNLRSLYHNILK